MSLTDLGGAAPRHILYLIDQLDSLEGGAERSLWLTTRLLPPDRYRPTVVTFKEPADPLCRAQFSCPVHVLPLNRSYDWRALIAALRLWRLIREERIEIVQTFFETSDLFGGLVAKLSGCQAIVSSRRDMGYRRLLKHNVGYRLLGSMFDMIHTVSDSVREYTIRQDHAKPERVVTIPNGVDMDQVRCAPGLTQLRSQYGLEGASHVIVDVTTLRPVKGIDILIRTAIEVCRQFPRAMFVVAGGARDEAYFAELQDMLRHLGMASNFRLLGRVDSVYPLLKVCDIFCHLSRSDGMSNAVLEAMACGLPCVVSHAGGNADLIEEGGNGFVVPVENPELAADRVIALLHYQDSARRMGARGRQIVSGNFTAESMVHGLVTLYDRLLRDCPPAKLQESQSANVSVSVRRSR